MALYSVVRTDTVGWDEYDEVIVRAGSEAAALKMVIGPDANDGMGYSGFDADGSNARVALNSPRGAAEVILASFNAG